LLLFIRNIFVEFIIYIKLSYTFTISFNYKLTHLNITNNEHTIQINYTNGRFAVIDGKLAVVGVFIKMEKENKNFNNIITCLPGHRSEAKQFGKIISINTLLSHSKSYIHYFGSLPTLPRLKNLNWRVLKTYLKISKKNFIV